MEKDNNSSQIKPWAALNWPNRISLLRVLLIAPYIVLLLNQQEPGWEWARHAALGVFVIMAVSDAIDGLLARKLDQRTRLGAILDPIADKALIMCSVVLLSIPSTAVPGNKLDNWVVVAVVGKDLWVILGFVVIYLVTDRFRVKPTIAGKLSTAGQLVMVVSFLVAPDLNFEGFPLGSHIARAMAVLVVALCVLAIISYTRLGLTFIAQEEKPLDNNGSEDHAEQ
ncbi:MAG: CDP-alcohol phosphatidyltransferase family protein [Phycisphaerae bacterium]